MKTTVPLRIASVLTLIHAVLHTVGGVFGKPSQGAAAAAVAAMQMNQFPTMGFMRSYWEFYRGMGMGVTIVLTIESIVFWQLGTLAKTQSMRLRPILAVFLVAYVALAVNSYAYFFMGPVIAELLIAMCLGFAVVTARTTVAA